jgi:hypothetical protein
MSLVDRSHGERIRGEITSLFGILETLCDRMSPSVDLPSRAIVHARSRAGLNLELILSIGPQE